MAASLPVSRLGTGNEPYQADIALQDNRIVAIGKNLSNSALSWITAGKVLRKL